MLIFLIFLAALALEGIGTYVSVLGLSQTFQGDPIILTLAIILDFAKIIGVSLLYKKWDVMHTLMKAYLIPAVIVLMLITSYGAAGYLSGKFQNATLPMQEANITLVSYNTEKVKLELRLKQINDGLAAINADYITKRLEETAAKKPELDRINARVVELDSLIPELKRTIVQIEAHVGPISFISKTFDISNSAAVSFIIAMIIFVFDPLAIVLILAGNFLLAQRAEEKKAKQELDAPKAEDMIIYDDDGKSIGIRGNKGPDDSGLAGVRVEYCGKCGGYLGDVADDKVGPCSGYCNLSDSDKQKWLKGHDGDRGVAKPDDRDVTGAVIVGKDEPIDLGVEITSLSEQPFVLEPIGDSTWSIVSDKKPEIIPFVSEDEHEPVGIYARQKQAVDDVKLGFKYSTWEEEELAYLEELERQKPVSDDVLIDKIANASDEDKKTIIEDTKELLITDSPVNKQSELDGIFPDGKSKIKLMAEGEYYSDSWEEGVQGDMMEQMSEPESPTESALQDVPNDGDVVIDTEQAISGDYYDTRNVIR